jgi:hypothetical protein
MWGLADLPATHWQAKAEIERQRYMKTIKLPRSELDRRERRKKLLLWQADQLERFKPFKLVRLCK